MPIMIVMRGHTPPARCAVCHDALDPADALLSICPACRSAAHVECREELGRCPSLTCGPPPVIRVRLQPTPAQPLPLRPAYSRYTEWLIAFSIIAILLISAVTAFRDSLDNTFNGPCRQIDVRITQPINQGG